MAELVVLNFKAAEGKFKAVADMFRAVLGDTLSLIHISEPTRR